MKLATLCYVRHDGRTLMLHRNKKPNDIHEGKWNGLGGKFEPGETPEACAAREVREESGLIAETLELKGFLTFPEFKDGEDWYVFLFLVSRFQGTLGECSEGRLEWIANDRLLDLNLWEGDRHFLPLLDQPGIFTGHFAYRDKQLVDFGLTRY